MDGDSIMKQKEMIPTAGNPQGLVLSILRDVPQEQRQISYDMTSKN